MTRSQLQLRKELFDRQDAALKLDRAGPEFEQEMASVAGSLEALAEEADHTGIRADVVERARTWRYAATAYFDLSRGKERSALERAVAAFGKAENLLGSADEPVERVKLAYCFGETLLCLSEASGLDLRLARQARDQFAKGIPLARTHMPEGLAQLAKRQRNAETVMTALGKVEGLDRRISELKSELADLDNDTPPASEATSSSVSSAAPASTIQELFGKLKAEVEGDNSIGPVRRQIIDSAMKEFGAMVESESSGLSIADGNARHGKLIGLIQGLAPQMARPGRSIRAPRVRRLVEALDACKMAMTTYALRSGMPASTRQAAIAVTGRIASAAGQIAQADGDSDTLRSLEADLARGAVHEARLIARRPHLMLARPVWPVYGDLVEVNRIFFSGPAGTRELVVDAARKLGLETDRPARTGAESAQARWQDLRSTGVAVFDISGADPQVCYELGSALAAGVEVLLIAAEGTKLPFNIAQEVRYYPARQVPKGFIANALEDGLYGLHLLTAQQSSTMNTLAYARQLAKADAGNAALKLALGHLGDAAADPLAFQDAANLFNGLLGANQHEILLPRWPCSYPDRKKPRCFSVMPFRGQPERAFSTIAACATKAGVKPIRGDVSEGQQIIQSIWDEICRATHITVDLTGFNPNVCLELGIAHALGRPTRIIGVEGTNKSIFKRLPSVSKWRVHTYPREGRPTRDFQAMLDAFFLTERNGLWHGPDGMDTASP